MENKVIRWQSNNVVTWWHICDICRSPFLCTRSEITNILYPGIKGINPCKCTVTKYKDVIYSLCSICINKKTYANDSNN